MKIVMKTNEHECETCRNEGYYPCTCNLDALAEQGCALCNDRGFRYCNECDTLLTTALNVDKTDSRAVELYRFVVGFSMLNFSVEDVEGSLNLISALQRKAKSLMENYDGKL